MLHCCFNNLFGSVTQAHRDVNVTGADLVSVKNFEKGSVGLRVVQEAIFDLVDVADSAVKLHGTGLRDWGGACRGLGVALAAGEGQRESRRRLRPCSCPCPRP